MYEQGSFWSRAVRGSLEPSSLSGRGEVMGTGREDKSVEGRQYEGKSFGLHKRKR